MLFIQQVTGGLVWERKKRRKSVVKSTKKRKGNAALIVLRPNPGFFPRSPELDLLSPTRGLARENSGDTDRRISPAGYL